MGTITRRRMPVGRGVTEEAVAGAMMAGEAALAPSMRLPRTTECADAAWQLAASTAARAWLATPADAVRCSCILISMPKTPSQQAPRVQAGTPTTGLDNGSSLDLAARHNEPIVVFPPTAEPNGYTYRGAIMECITATWVSDCYQSALIGTHVARN